MYPRASRPLVALALVGLLGGTATGARADLPDFKPIIQANQASVVNISTRQEADGRNRELPPAGAMPPGFEEFFRRFQPPRDGRALGSGFIISADGQILTNAHVVDGATEIIVKLADNTEKPARLLGLDKASDVALLKVDATNLRPVRLGNSAGVEVGDWVLAIGSPFGLEHTATQGIVSAVGRSLPDGNYVPFIQTDVAVNPGNSGGPLFNIRGDVIGINSQIYSRSGGYMGLSFAIPVNVATSVARQLAATGRVERGWLGLAVQGVNTELARSFGLPRPRGALVGDVTAGSPAARAGIETGDIIIAYQGKDVPDSAALPLLVGETAPGTRVNVTVWRNRRELSVPVTVAVLAPSPDEVVAAARQGSKSGPGILNLQVAPLSATQRSNSGVADGGVLVVGVGAGPAERAGVTPGDIILRVAGKPVASPDQLAGLAKQLPKGEPVPLLVQRNQQRLFLPLTVGS